MADRYDSFEKLKCCETRGIDYEIRLTRRDSPVAIMAPHGGEIEPGTTLLAEAIAKCDYNFYSMLGLKKNRPHGDLHITSSKFDEPECVSLISGCDFVVAIHGRADESDPQTIWVGGRDTNLSDAIETALNAKRFPTGKVSGRLAGKHPSNICNRGRQRQGVQLELPRTLRNELQKTRDRFNTFSDAVRDAIAFAT